MNGAVSLILILAGIALLVFGIQSAESLGSQLSEFFTGSPTDRTVWFLILGTVLLIFGLASTTMRRSRSAD